MKLNVRRVNHHAPKGTWLGVIMDVNENIGLENLELSTRKADYTAYLRSADISEDRLPFEDWLETQGEPCMGLLRDE